MIIAGMRWGLDTYAPRPVERPADPRSVFEFRGLDKKSHHYEARAIFFVHDGTVATAYQDPRDAAGNYVALSAADGTVRWERRVGEGLRDMQAAPDGSLRVLTSTALYGIGADGRDRFEVPLGGGARMVVDSTGTAWLLEAGELRAVSPDGSERPLPPTDVEYDEIATGGPGWVLGRRVNELWRLDSASGEAQLLHTQRSGSGVSAKVLSVQAVNGGGLALQVEDTVSVSYHPPPGMGRFGPASDPDHWGRTISSVQKLVLVAPDGAASALPLPTNTEEVAVRPGSVLAHRGRDLVLLDAAGNSTRIHTPALGIYDLRGFAPDGRAVLREGDRFWLLDVSSGALTCMTDHEKDASWRLAEPSASPATTPGTVRMEPEFVEVDGVRVPRRSISPSP